MKTLQVERTHINAVVINELLYGGLGSLHKRTSARSATGLIYALCLLTTSDIIMVIISKTINRTIQVTGINNALS